MKQALNIKLRKLIQNGKYIASEYYETMDMTRKRMSDTDYHYSIATADNTFRFFNKTYSCELPLKDFDWRILWEKLGDVPVNDNDELEEAFEHFEVGADRMEVWSWFEWFFEIKLGEEIYK
jgi:hypothetical protein